LDIAPDHPLLQSAGAHSSLTFPTPATNITPVLESDNWLAGLLDDGRGPAAVNQIQVPTLPITTVGAYGTADNVPEPGPAQTAADNNAPGQMTVTMHGMDYTVNYISAGGGVDGREPMVHMSDMLAAQCGCVNSTLDRKRIYVQLSVKQALPRRVEMLNTLSFVMGRGARYMGLEGMGVYMAYSGINKHKANGVKLIQLVREKLFTTV
jgi:hypothetical protein